MLKNDFEISGRKTFLKNDSEICAGKTMLKNKNVFEKRFPNQETSLKNESEKRIRK